MIKKIEINFNQDDILDLDQRIEENGKIVKLDKFDKSINKSIINKKNINFDNSVNAIKNIIDKINKKTTKNEVIFSENNKNSENQESLIDKSEYYDLRNKIQFLRNDNIGYDFENNNKSISSLFFLSDEEMFINIINSSLILFLKIISDKKINFIEKNESEINKILIFYIKEYVKSKFYLKIRDIVIEFFNIYQPSLDLNFSKIKIEILSTPVDNKAEFDLLSNYQIKYIKQHICIINNIIKNNIFILINSKFNKKILSFTKNKNILEEEFFILIKEIEDFICKIIQKI